MGKLSGRHHRRDRFAACALAYFLAALRPRPHRNLPNIKKKLAQNTAIHTPKVTMPVMAVCAEVESTGSTRSRFGQPALRPYDQSSNSTILIDFHLYGTVPEEPA